MLANGVRSLLINILCTAHYGYSWLLFLYSFLRVLLWIENKTDTSSKKLIENFQCIWFSQSLSQFSIWSVFQIIAGKSFEEDLAEAHLEPSATSTIELFCENSYAFYPLTTFTKKFPLRFSTGF